VGGLAVGSYMASVMATNSDQQTTAPATAMTRLFATHGSSAGLAGLARLALLVAGCWSWIRPLSFLVLAKSTPCWS